MCSYKLFLLPLSTLPLNFAVKEYYLLRKLKIFRENDSLSNSASHFIADVLHTGTELLVGAKLSSVPVIQLLWELIAVVPQVLCQVQGCME